MKLKTKLMLLLIIAIILPIISGIAYTYIKISDSINKIEIDKAKANITRVNSYVKLLESIHGESYLTWTSWTEYYDAVANKDVDWVNENILNSAKEDTNNEVIIVLNNDGSILAEANSPKEWKDIDFSSTNLFKKLDSSLHYVSGIEKTSVIRMK